LRPRDPCYSTRDLADALRRAQQLIASDPDAAVLVEDAETGEVFTIDRHCVARIEVTEPRRQVRAYHLVRKAP
jgi:hypothetical protein